ncbi:transposase [Paraclostridium sordellii]|uniref:helix-turn-helix transcriptional regulator n=1 Tax=Paraclostridium sordellii TaxID=1505 RepID=UPI0030CED50B
MGKSKYFTHVEPKLEEVRKWAKDGLSDKQIATNLGIAYSTFREYKKKFLALSAPLKEGKACAVKQVENALFKKALGYEYEEVTKEICMNEETGKQELKITKVVTKRVHPDTTAIIFYLKNRMSDKWKNDPHKVKMDDAILELRKKELELKEW